MDPIILIVDDNIEITEFLSATFKSRYTVLTAFNGREALELLDRETIHLVVSDVMMPVMDGFEFCRIIKSSIDHCHIPVVLLTAKKTLEAKIDGLELGADAYIEKPFSPKHLDAQISNLLANRNKLREFFANSPLVNLKSIAYSKRDEDFLEILTNFINQNFRNHELGSDELAKAMNMSRPTFYRKIKEISNLSPVELINITRLKKAAELIVEGRLKVFEIADVVGFASQQHFARNFSKQFGQSPTEYQMAHRGE